MALEDEMASLASASLRASDLISAILILVGTIYLTGVLKLFLGNKLRAPSLMIGSGLLLFALLHEFGELLYGFGIHGGFPKTLFGSVHIIVFGSAGSAIFFAGCCLIYRRYSDYLRED